MTAPPRNNLSAVGVGALLLAAAASLAQYQVGSGRALDRNLNVNSGGYNSTTTRQAYIQPSPYTVNYDTGDIEYNESNAFAQPRYTWSRAPESFAFWNRPTVMPSGEGNLFQVDRRTGTYKYNTTAAFAAPDYNPLRQPPNVYGQGIYDVNMAPQQTLWWRRRIMQQPGTASTAIPSLGPGNMPPMTTLPITSTPAPSQSMSPTVTPPVAPQKYQVPLPSRQTGGEYTPL